MTRAVTLLSGTSSVPALFSGLTTFVGVHTVFTPGLITLVCVRTQRCSKCGAAVQG